MIALCSLDDIEDGGALALETGERRLVAVRKGEQVWVYRNCCPHFSVGLDFQPGVFCTYRGQVLMCAHHSALFRFEDGQCIDGPCKGARLEAVPVRMQGRWVVLP
ncbi:Rieske [2Fe-2S] domain protein [compost metagenome]